MREGRRGARVVIGLKKEWSDGTREMELSCTELVEKLVALVPRPRVHTVIYSGVFAAHHALRAEVVPGRKAEGAAAVARRRGRKLTKHPERGGDGRWSWAELLRRTFHKDGWSCPSCGKPMRLRVVIEDGPTASRVLTSLCRAREPTGA